ncbi:murein hydrolase activator EnvC family protein [Sphingomonas quercus]|uniref:Peptidoglycan DD-metalloendopeptidase family protein n=1 Tax=Sphingomonas quercus TaxID=2842451 RepID=A0ABS6BJM5_9SPHN|nr:peptidoglycan DD-metalloendopeptidase family protein [Sphingomonas quercus]MBU3078503.1 peptidoglycan DD-metalloendopeptidase family protein [Sphingomonas quercus]
MRALLPLLLLSTAALAQDDPATLNRQAAAAEAQAGRIEADAARVHAEADRALDEAGRLAAQVSTAQAHADAARAEVERLDRLRAAQRARLAARQAPIARLGAALEVMARRPEPLLFVSPGSAADIVHTKLALDAARPAIAARTAALRAEIAAGERLRGAATRAVAARDDAVAQLSRDRTALLRFAEAQRTEAAGLVDAALRESDRALALSADAGQAREDRAQAAMANAEARALAMLPAPAPLDEATAPRGSGWALPVAGRLVTGFGALDGGARSRGIVLAATRGAVVRAPAVGSVAFAGAFRDYGRVVILNHPGGWTTLIAGLADIDVAQGGSAAAGARLGTAGARIMIEVRSGGVPVDVAALAAQGGWRTPLPPFRPML